MRKRQKGFTLIELMVVMAILAVLAGIVFPAVTGTKGVSEDTQVRTDVQGTQNAVNKFNNDSTTAAFPETDLTAPTGTTITGVTTGANATHTKILWTATTSVRKEDGSMVTMTFVPDFVNKKPASVDLLLSAGIPNYLWLLKMGAAADNPTRTVEVYESNAAGTTYTLLP